MHPGEKKLYEYLKSILPVSTIIIYNAKFNWSKNKTYLPYDFYIVDKRTIVELDGPQHYGELHIWDCERVMKTDKIKDTAALENKFKLIRVKYASLKTINWKRLKEELEAPFNVEIIRIGSLEN